MLCIGKCCVSQQDAFLIHGLQEDMGHIFWESKFEAVYVALQEADTCPGYSMLDSVFFVFSFGIISLMAKLSFIQDILPGHTASFYFTIVIRMHHYGHLLIGYPSLSYNIHSKDCSYCFPCSPAQLCYFLYIMMLFRLHGDKDCANYFPMHLHTLPKTLAFLFTALFAQHTSLIGKIPSFKNPCFQCLSSTPQTKTHTSLLYVPSMPWLGLFFLLVACYCLYQGVKEHWWLAEKRGPEEL